MTSRSIVDSSQCWGQGELLIAHNTLYLNGKLFTSNVSKENFTLSPLFFSFTQTVSYLAALSQLCHCTTDLTHSIWVDIFPRIWKILSEKQQGVGGVFFLKTLNIEAYRKIKCVLRLFLWPKILEYEAGRDSSIMH